MCSDCNTIVLGNFLYTYKLMRSLLSTNRFLSPRPSESSPSYTHRVHNTWTVAVNHRTLDLTKLCWSHIYSDLPLSCFAIYQNESILCHLGHMNPESYVPRQRQSSRTMGSILYVDSVSCPPLYEWFVNNTSAIWLFISRDAMVVWYWEHPISFGLTHCSISELSFS
jgi:hypothetical protein